MDESKAQHDISPEDGVDTNDSAPHGAERIAKYLSRAGICSRRDAERLIEEGRVRVNGVVIDTPVVLVTSQDRIIVDGQQVDGPQEIRLFRYNKPAGLVTTNRDEMGRDTIFDHIPEELPRLMTVGRLDINTEGLLLLTTDGELARQLELPSTGWTRRYKVRAFGELDEGKLAHIRRGVSIEGIDYAPAKVDVEREQGANMWLTIALTEGKNREVKKLLDYCGLRVNRLIRLSYGPFQLGTLPSGAVEEIKRHVLREQVPGLEGRLKEEQAAKKDAAKDTRGRLAGEHAKYTPPSDAKRKKVKAAAKPERTRDDAREDRRDEGRAPRREWTPRGERPAGDDQRSNRPRADRPRSDRPRPERSGDDRPARRYKDDGDKKPFRPARTGRPYEKRDGDAPRDDFKKRGEFAGRGGYGEASDRPRTPRGGDDRPRRSYDDKPRARRAEGDDSRPPRKEWAPRGDRPAGDYQRSDRPRSDRSGADRPARRYKDEGDQRGYGRADGDKKPFRRDRDDRPFEKRGGDRPRPARDGEDRPRRPRAEGDRPAGDRPRFKRDDDGSRAPRPRREDGDFKPRSTRPRREDGDAADKPARPPKAKKPAKKAGIIKKPEPRAIAKKPAKPAPQRVPGNPIAGTLRINKTDGE